MKYETVNDAAHAWVREFNAVPMAIVEKLMVIDPDNLIEVTPPSCGDRVTVYLSECFGECGEITESMEIDGMAVYRVKLDSGVEYSVSEPDLSVERDDYLPMWGTMWAFDDQLDNYWLEKYENLQKMADCGFRIYEQEDYEFLFGIDGAGYDFYEAHWEPLYKARGLQWHAA